MTAGAVSATESAAATTWGRGVPTAGDPPDPSEAPQSPQKRARAGFVALHAGQTRLRGAPQSPQNRRPLSFSPPQLAQVTASSSLVLGPDRSLPLPGSLRLEQSCRRTDSNPRPAVYKTSGTKRCSAEFRSPSENVEVIYSSTAQSAGADKEPPAAMVSPRALLSAPLG